MKSNHNRILVSALTVLGAAAGFFLRRWQLGCGRPVPAGCPANWPLGLVCAVITVVLAVLCSRLVQRERYTDAFSSGFPELLVSVGAAVLVLVGSAMELMERPDGFASVVVFLGLATGLCIAVVAVMRYRGTVPPVALHVLPCIYLIVKLIFDFKHWSVDPAVLDYCFELFAAITAMIAAFQLGGFCYGKGHRRMTAFWCLSCVVFSAVSLADGGLHHTLLVGGVGLWAAANGWQLLEE